VESRIAALEGKFQELEGKFQTFKAEMIAVFEKAQVKMQETIITTMKWYIGGAGIVLVVLKALDSFVQG
jgi:hypothetical protein